MIKNKQFNIVFQETDETSKNQIEEMNSSCSTLTQEWSVVPVENSQVSFIGLEKRFINRAKLPLILI